MPTDTLLIALTTFFATIGPADLALVFAGLTHKNSAVERRVFALRGVLVAGGILLFFAAFGNALLGLFGITLPDISVFPLATPLIAGPGAISATILLVTGAQGDQLKLAAVVVALLLILGLTYLALLAAIPIQRILGLTGLAVVSRIVGVLLAALSVQFIFDGIKASGLLGH